MSLPLATLIDDLARQRACELVERMNGNPIGAERYERRADDLVREIGGQLSAADARIQRLEQRAGMPHGSFE